MGDPIAANMFMVGFAWQQGGLPISRASIVEAIRLNGVEAEMNIAAFEWGRRAAHDPGAVERSAGLSAEKKEPSFRDFVARRKAFLRDYQDTSYVERYARGWG